MFTKISWTDYFIAIGLLITGYYLFVGLRYYSNDLKELNSGKRKLKFGKKPVHKLESKSYLVTEKTDHLPDANFELNTDDEMAEVEHLVERLKGVIAEASGKKLIPEEFIQYLELVLREYPNIRNSPYRSSINELITSECEKYGTVTLSEEEIELLWEDAS